MNSEGLKQRHTGSVISETKSDLLPSESSPLPNGKIIGHRKIKSQPRQKLVAFAFGLVFILTSCSLHVLQYLGLPLHRFRPNSYYAWQAGIKRKWAVLLIALNSVWNPTDIEVTWDDSVHGEIHALNNRTAVKYSFANRLVLMANHQIYTDWVFLWWSAYMSGAAGNLFIALRQDVRHIPLLGWGMRFFSFVFIRGSIEKDGPNLAHRLQRLNEISTQSHSPHVNPPSTSTPAANPADATPMWFLIFPEGTTIHGKAYRKGLGYIEKGLKSQQDNPTPTRVPEQYGLEFKQARPMRTRMPDHSLIPRPKGLFTVLTELRKTTDYLYDCTINYTDVPSNRFGQDYFTLTSIYVANDAPKKIHMHWRRFKIADIPLQDLRLFQDWLVERFDEKDALLRQWHQTGQFPAPDHRRVLTKAAGTSVLEVLPLVPLFLAALYVTCRYLPSILYHVVYYAIYVVFGVTFGALRYVFTS